MFIAALFTIAWKYIEITQLSTDRWKDKQNVVDTYNGILFSFKKEAMTLQVING